MYHVVSWTSVATPRSAVESTAGFGLGSGTYQSLLVLRWVKSGPWGLNSVRSCVKSVRYGTDALWYAKRVNWCRLVSPSRRNQYCSSSSPTIPSTLGWDMIMPP
jgi:hypothetical protein